MNGKKPQIPTPAGVVGTDEHGSYATECEGCRMDPCGCDEEKFRPLDDGQELSYSDGMLDLETLGKRAGCAVVEIGLVLFDPWSGKTGAEFHAEVSVVSNIKRGLIADPNAMKFHEENDRLETIMQYTTPLADALESLAEFIDLHNPQMVWVKGGEFDWPILRFAYEKAGIRFFVQDDERKQYRKMTCIRGLVDLGARMGAIPPESEWDIPHHAIGDAHHQIRMLSRALKALSYFDPEIFEMEVEA